MSEDRILFETIVPMTQQVNLSMTAQNRAMGAANRVNAIEVQDGHARERALAGLSN